MPTLWDSMGEVRQMVVVVARDPDALAAMLQMATLDPLVRVEVREVGLAGEEVAVREEVVVSEGLAQMEE